MRRKTILFSLMLGFAVATSAQTLPYQNPDLTAEQRADDLVKRLTLEEKVKLMMNGSPAIERLGIPQFEWWNEALHGVGRNGFATVFPITMSMASSWNHELLEDVFTAVSDEARAKNQEAKQRGKMKRYQGLSFWTPNINIFRDPRWGRGQETYGEDPYLTTKMGLAVVRGLEGPKGSKYRKLLSCAKHYAVHSGPEWNRHSFNMTNLPPRDLWETYMPAFKALVQEGDVAEVMCAYQRNDGDPCCGNIRYEQQILRDEWGFKGLIVSDCGAIGDFWKPGRHGVSKDAASASARAVLSGTDVECGGDYRNLPEAIRRGEIKESDLDVSVRRLLISRFLVGDMTPDEYVEWTKIPSSVIASKKHKDLAYKMAQQGTVLMQNNGILPLSKSNNDIVVMGANANDSVMMWGNYCGFPTKTVTILEGIRNKVGNVKYVQGCGLTSSETLVSKFANFVSPDGKKGMRAKYWNNTKKEGNPATTVYINEPMNLSNGGATVYAPGVNLEEFSARYEGSYTPAKDETITIKISCDDHGIVVLNGDTIINVVNKSDKLGIGSREIKMKAGQKYDLVIDYIVNTTAADSFDDLFENDYKEKLSTENQLPNETALADDKAAMLAEITAELNAIYDELVNGTEAEEEEETTTEETKTSYQKALDEIKTKLLDAAVKTYESVIVVDHPHYTLPAEGEEDKTSALDKWLFNAETKVGDTKTTENIGDTTSTYTVSILKTASTLKDENSTYDVGHILVKFDVEGDAKPTEEQKAAAKAEAQAILDQYLAGEKTLDAFKALGEEKTDDSNVVYENVTKGQMVEAFETWSLDEARKEGDTEIVETEYGYHIMYFIDNATTSEAGVLADLYGDWVDAESEKCNYTYKQSVIDSIQ